VTWSDSFRSLFSFLWTSSRRENAVAQYVIREHHRGRSVTEIVEDPYVKNRVSPEQLSRILERPEVLHAIGGDPV
jgi:hypothetical protein